MALITNRGKLINDLPLSNEVKDDDLLIIQKTADNVNRTERITFGFIKNYILSKASENVQNFLDPSEFTNVSNKFTGSFYSPDNGFANFYKVKIRNALDFSGNLTILNLDCNNIDVSGTVNTSIIGAGSGTFNSLISNANSYLYNQLTTDNIENSNNINTDTLSVGNVASISTIYSINTSVGNDLIVKNIKNTANGSISGSLLGSLISKNTKATGSFYGNFKGDFLDVTNGYVYTNALRVFGPSIFANNANLAIKRVTTFEGLYGDVYGNIYNPADGTLCTSTDGTDYSPSLTSKVSKFYGTSSYSVKSQYAENFSGVVTQAKTSSYVSYVGYDNGTVYNSINSVTSYQSAVLRGMYTFQTSILLTGSASYPTSWLGGWQQFPSANDDGTGTLTGSINLLSLPDSGIRNIPLKNHLNHIRNNHTNYTASYLLIRAELIGKAGPSNGDTSNYLINEPHYAKLQFITDIDDDSYFYSINPTIKQLVIPFQRTTSPSCHSECSTFLIKVPDLIFPNGEQYLFYLPVISSSVGKEITTKANAQFSWSYKIYLDGVI